MSEPSTFVKAWQQRSKSLEEFESVLTQQPHLVRANKPKQFKKRIDLLVAEMNNLLKILPSPYRYGHLPDHLDPGVVIDMSGAEDELENTDFSGEELEALLRWDTSEIPGHMDREHL